MCSDGVRRESTIASCVNNVLPARYVSYIVDLVASNAATADYDRARPVAGVILKRLNIIDRNYRVNLIMEIKLYANLRLAC